MEKNPKNKKPDWINLTLILLSAFIAVFLVVMLLNWFLNPAFKTTVQDKIKHTVGAVGDRIDHLVKPDDQKPTVLNREYNLLLLGVDESNLGARSRTDGIMVMRIDPVRGWIGAVSIPRDTLARLPSGEITKVNHAYAFGGIEMSRDTVEDLLKIQIDRYLVTNFDGFKKAVDLLGGVDIVIERNMRYTDRRGGLRIDLRVQKDEDGNPLAQRLDGERAMHYVRFRSDREGDLGRVRRHQEFLKALFHRIVTEADIPDALRLIDQFGQGKLLLTDLSASELQGLQGLMQKMQREPDRYRMLNIALNGTPVIYRELSSVVLDPDLKYHAIRAIFYRGYDPDNERITVKVLNGCGIPGKAQQYTAALGVYGYGTVEPGNYDQRLEHSRLEVHNPELRPAGLAELLMAEIKYAAPVPGQEHDVTAVLGRSLCVR